MPTAVVLAHSWIAGELGHLEPWLDAHGFTVTRVDRDDAPSIPAADLLIVLGSPDSVVPEHCTPASQAEIDAVRSWVSGGRPYLGICFGAQVLATALGGSVRRMPAPFIGYTPLEISEAADESVRGPWTLWHNDGITAPAHAEVLGSLDHADLVFRVGSAWGVQPHIEVTAEILQRMANALGADASISEPIVAALRADSEANAVRARALLDAFLVDVSLR